MALRCAAKRSTRTTTPRAIYTGVGPKKLRFADIDEALLLAAAEDMFSTWRSSSDTLIASYHAWEQDLPQYPSPLLPPPTERVPQNVRLPEFWTMDVALEPLPAESPVPIASDAQAGGAS